MKISKNDNSPFSIEIHKPAIFAEQTSQLYAAVNSALVATLINSYILVAVLWPVIEHDILLSWLIAIVLVSLARGITAIKYNKVSRSADETLTWFRYFFAGTILASLVWGSASIWLFPLDDIARQVFIAFVVGGMVAGAITSLSHVKLIIYVYIAFTLLPLLIRFFYSESELGFAMGSMLTLYFFMMIIAATRTHNHIIQNISLHLESIQREKTLQQSESRYKTLLETATDAFFLHDANGRFVDVNQEACKSLGYSHDELLKMSVADIEVNQNPEALNQLWPKLKKGENVRLDGVHMRKNGSTFPVEVRIGMIHINDEDLFSVLARDVTERERIDKMKDEFISTVSHELRTPLTSIRGSIGLINGGAVGELSGEIKDILKIASNNTERLLLLINDILDIQKIESGEMKFNLKPLEVMPFLEQAINDNAAYGELYDVNFVITKRIDDAKIYADKDRMMQVMANLLSNAAKFSEKGGTVEVKVEKIKNKFRVSIMDHGTGIPEEFKDKIFNKFTQLDSSDTRQKGGTGLGLNITQLIIERQNGRIDFYSEAGSGTTFYFEMPEHFK